MSCFDGDVRPLSNDQRYMGVVFSGTLNEALQQAKRAIEYGTAPIPMAVQRYRAKHRVSRDRIALLQHLNLMPL